MNKELEFLINTGNIVKRRTLEFYEDDISIAYTTEYLMNANMGPLNFWIAWINHNCADESLLRAASIHIHDARLYFPEYLDTRIPIENRCGL